MRPPACDVVAIGARLDIDEAHAAPTAREAMRLAEAALGAPK